MSVFYTYLIESSVSLGLFYLFYELFLKRDTWFRFNRYYLLFGVIFSLIIPLLDFSASSLVVNSQNQFEFNEYLQVGSAVNDFKEQTVEFIAKPNYLLLLYLFAASLFFVRFIYQLVKILKTINANEIINYKNKKIVLLNNNHSPFSFFNYIFINKEDYGSMGSRELLQHEITHAKQKHSIDIILLELILVLQWFNPFIYRYRLAFKEIHEYLADRGVLIANNNDKIGYQKLILDQIEKSFGVSLASQFNYSLTKNRIKMMTRINSKNISKLKILLVTPLLTLLLMAFTIDTAKERNVVKSQLQVQTQNYNQENANTNSFIFPVKKVEGVEISSGYGERIHPIKKKKMMHNAVDIKAPRGTQVYATADGLVRKVKENFKEGEGYGRYIIIDHENGFSTLYAQLESCSVKEGQEIKQGNVIGGVGSSGQSTGPHLHFEMKKDGEYVNPEKYF